MLNLQWKPGTHQQKQGDDPKSENIWFGVSMMLLGAIAGFLLMTFIR